MGDHLRIVKSPLRRTRHPGLLSLSPPSVAGWNEYPVKAAGANRHIAWYNGPYPWSRSVVLVPGWLDWLAEISADLREVVAHLRRVRDNALYKSTVTLLYFTSPSPTVLIQRFALNWAMVKRATLNWATENWATGKFGNCKFGNHLFGWVGKVGNGKMGNGKLFNWCVWLCVSRPVVWFLLLTEMITAWILHVRVCFVDYYYQASPWRIWLRDVLYLVYFIS